MFFASQLISIFVNCDYNCDGQILISFVFPQFISSSFYVSFLSRVMMNSINWPAPNIWVFIAQLVEHCSANAETMGSNPVEALKFFSGLNLQLPKLRLQLRWSNPHFILCNVHCTMKLNSFTLHAGSSTRNDVKQTKEQPDCYSAYKRKEVRSKQTIINLVFPARLLAG